MKVKLFSMELKKVKVVMLPSKYDNRSEGQLCISNGEIKGNLFISEENVSSSIHIPQHLHFITDEEIKEGDWFIELNLNGKRKGSSNMSIHCDIGNTGNFILTRNNGNFPFPKNCKKIIATTDPELNLPQPSRSFIKEYCRVGIINEVMIEYESSLKVNSRNEITIYPIKDSWNKEDMINFGEYIMKMTNQVIKKKTRMKPLDDTTGLELVKYLFNKFIES